MVAFPLVFQFLQVWFGLVSFGLVLVQFWQLNLWRQQKWWLRFWLTSTFSTQEPPYQRPTVPASSSSFCSWRSQCIEIGAGHFRLVTVFQRKALQQVPYLPALLTFLVHVTIPLWPGPEFRELMQCSDALYDACTGLNIHTRWSECTVNSEQPDLQHKLVNREV